MEGGSPSSYIRFEGRERSRMYHEEGQDQDYSTAGAEAEGGSKQAGRNKVVRVGGMGMRRFLLSRDVSHGAGQIMGWAGWAGQGRARW